MFQKKKHTLQCKPTEQHTIQQRSSGPKPTSGGRERDRASAAWTWNGPYREKKAARPNRIGKPKHFDDRNSLPLLLVARKVPMHSLVHTFIHVVIVPASSDLPLNLGFNYDNPVYKPRSVWLWFLAVITWCWRMSESYLYIVGRGQKQRSHRRTASA